MTGFGGVSIRDPGKDFRESAVKVFPIVRVPFDAARDFPNLFVEPPDSCVARRFVARVEKGV